MVPYEKSMIGKTVYANFAYSGVEELTILEMRQEENRGTGKIIKYYHCKCHSIGVRDCLPENMFLKKEDLLDNLKKESESLVHQYCQTITTKEELLSFMLDEMRKKEFPNYEAIETAKKKIKEIFSINM